MKIGVLSGFSTFTPPEFIAASGRIAEDRGFHSFWVPEHVLFFSEYASRYPYSADGKIPGNPDGVLEPLTALAFLAAHTERIRLGTGICLVPQRNPVYTAKQTADVDFLSGGRLDFGVGIMPLTAAATAALSALSAKHALSFLITRATTTSIRSAISFSTLERDFSL